MGAVVLLGKIFMGNVFFGVVHAVYELYAQSWLIVYLTLSVASSPFTGCCRAQKLLAKVGVQDAVTTYAKKNPDGVITAELSETTVTAEALECWHWSLHQCAPGL